MTYSKALTRRLLRSISSASMRTAFSVCASNTIFGSSADTIPTE